MSLAAPRRFLRALALLFGWVGFVQTVNGVASPFLARSFALDDAGVARAFAFIAFSAPLVLVVARQVDRFGRRRLLLLCTAVLAPASLASAVAPSLPVFVASQIVVQALAGGLLMVAIVMIAEELPLGRRAAEQGRVGTASVLGGGACLLLVSLFADVPGSWRWAWVVAAAPLALLPWIARAVPETARWRAAEARGETERARLRDVLTPTYRARAIGLLGYLLLGSAAGTATGTWPFYHLVHTLGLSPAFGTVVLFAGGGVGMLGFALGGRLCDRLGRRYTLAFGALASVGFMIAFYWVPAEWATLRPFALAGSFAAASFCSNASIVAVRAAATELFPTRIRSSINGWAAVATAIGSVLVHFATAALSARLGGLAPAISLLGLLMLPAVLLWLVLVPETMGLELEAAALEQSVVWQEVLVSIGSNLGDRDAALAHAVTHLREIPEVEVLELSRVYETDPVGPPPQGPYLNAAARLRTCLAPRELLERLLTIERTAGRERSSLRNEARVLDLDLLLFGTSCIDEPGLVVPHPRLHERAFVLEPLREIAAEWLHPLLGESIARLAERRRDPAGVRPRPGPSR